MKLSNQIFLQFLLSLLADVDVDVNVLLQHWLALSKHHHRTHGEIFKLIFPQESLRAEYKEDSDAPDDGDEGGLQVAGIPAVEGVTDQVGSGRALGKHSGVEGGVHNIVPEMVNI